MGTHENIQPTQPLRCLDGTETTDAAAGLLPVLVWGPLDPAEQQGET